MASTCSSPLSPSFSSPLSPSLTAISFPPELALPGAVPGTTWTELEITTKSTCLSSEDRASLDEPQPKRGSLFALAKLRQDRFKEKAIGKAPDKEERKVEKTRESDQVVSLDKGKVKKNSQDVYRVESIKKLDPLNQGYFEKAQECLDKSLLDEALDYLNEILINYPNFYPALEMRISIYYRKGLFDAALDNCNRIPNISRCLKALKVRLKILFDRELYLQAEADAQLILTTKPDDVDAIKYMGAICLQYSVDKTKAAFDRTAKAKEARKHLFAAIRKNPDDKFTLLFLARLYNHKENYIEALIFADPLLAKYPSDPQVLLVKAAISINMNRLPEAEKILAKIKKSKRNKEYKQLLEQIAQIKQTTGQVSTCTCSCIIC